MTGCLKTSLEFFVFLVIVACADCYSRMSNKTPHIERLVGAMLKVRNKENAASMTGYLKGHFPCLGIHRPERDKIQKKWFNELKEVENLNHWDVASTLWELEHREYQYVAIDYLKKIPKKMYEKDDYQRIEELITTKSWWDSVDQIASNIAGPYFQNCPDMRDPVITNWRNSKDLWLNRTCLLFQLRYKEKTDFELLKGLILQYMPVKEFFIQKAIGWSLRNYSRTEPDAVRNFVQDLDLSTVAKREAYKYI
jgi:3-methyladenine DNA glycosylase AlkD